MTNPAKNASAMLLQDAKDPGRTPFDYIVVGSGAGGGPMAARLALEGRRVLVIEAGVDPGDGKPLEDPATAPVEPGEYGVREVYAVPAYNGASTEEPDISWEFSVRHFADEELQRLDLKYKPAKDPSAKGGAAKGGIFYPRSSALGGCTAHYAMIIVRPNDSDWDRIAESTGDPSWRSEHMQGYFAKLEDCLYYKVYRGFLGWLRWLFALIDPRAQLEPGGHGSAGWQRTSFISPALILGIVKTDVTFLRVLFGVLRWALSDKDERSRLLRALLRGEIVQVLDPNVRSPDFPVRANRLSLIPIGADAACRKGLREHLLDVATKHPDRLALATGVHATRIIFERTGASGVPRAVGVEVAEGLHLYGASPLSGQAKPDRPSVPPSRTQYFASREVILSGGTFNTPQLLMLSGIGEKSHLDAQGIAGPRDRDGKEVAPVVNLPGVGENLQDRYEVSVVSEAGKDFSVLKGASFRPGDPNDPVRRQWIRDKSGLYTTNGVALAMLLSSDATARAGGDPDLFLFGVPAAFRGYYWDWSKELLRRTIHAPDDQRNLWSWVILKAYTHNNHGTVKLLSRDPFATPEIIFNSFRDGAGNAEDVAALCDAVRKARSINESIGAFATEVQPGPELPDGSSALAQWLRHQAWGHHACGTCRIGTDLWQPDPSKLVDVGAVLDSKFRVHGVSGLRVVDASVFPHIPGYFLATSVFMVGEKAADTLLADSSAYPAALEREEARAIHARREVAGLSQGDAVPNKLPEDAVGLALSGGGIRSATFCLGVLQALATCKRLGDIDFLSTVSGGGFAGGFVGRLFTRLRTDVIDKVERVQEILADKTSSEIWWLRKNADYIASAGLPDVETNLAIIARNLAAVYVFVGALLFAGFGALLLLAGALGPRLALPMPRFWNIDASFWWWVPLALLCFAVAPLAIGYWLTPGVGRRYPVFPLLLWVALLGGAVYALSLPGAAPWSAAAIGALLLAWVVQEVTRWKVFYEERVDRSDTVADATPDGVPNTLVRSRITRALGAVLLGFAVSIVWVVVDSLAQAVASPTATWAMIGSAPLILVLRMAASAWLKGASGGAALQWFAWARDAIVAGLAFLFAAVLIFFVDVLVHLAFTVDTMLGIWATVAALAGSIIVGRWLGFLNLSALQQAYGQKLVRTFLGASNDARVHPTGTADPTPVEIPSAGDDLFFDQYHPERNGGPLHLVNTCVNDTVDVSSGRQLRDNKGLSVCAGPAGISVGVRYHALWGPRDATSPAGASIVRPLAVAPDPNAFHVLARSDGRSSQVERLQLGQWVAISGAAVSTGTGRYTGIAQSLLLGLLNIRLGYWWDSGIRAGQRPGRYPPNLWRRFKRIPASVFRMQGTLLNEWRGYFQGPSERLWYLSDGGHFENTGLYELLRRRLPFIISVDGSEDQQYQMGDLAVLTRQVRLDFGAEIEWLDPSSARAHGKSDWAAFDDTLGSAPVPDWIREVVHADAVDALTALGRDSARCCALGRVTYRSEPGRASWLLLVKANLAPPLSVDVRNYADLHPTFPNESTADQFFQDDQWESYRALGQRAGQLVFRPAPARSPVAKPDTVQPSIQAKRVSLLDTIRMQFFVSIPTFLLGIVTANRWPMWLFSRWRAGRSTMRFLHDLRSKYASDHLWLWFPFRKTLLVFDPPTVDAVLASDANAADPYLKKRALSRFVPDALIVSSGHKWQDRRRFNEEVLCLGRPHRHQVEFTSIAIDEANRLPRSETTLRWTDFRSFGERLSQQIILGRGRVKPGLSAQLASLVKWSNLMYRDTVNYPPFQLDLEGDLAKEMPGGAQHCLMGDSVANRQVTQSTRVPPQAGFWLFVLKDALELHTARTLALIAAHPQVQEQVRNEVLAVDELTADAIDRSLPVLEACLHEQLRLWTAVPLLMRRATRQFFLRDEIPIEKDEQILIHAGFYHRDARIFGDFADRFAPAHARAPEFPNTYFFSGHRQSCAGQTLITFLLKASLASLLRRFRFELVAPRLDADAIPYLFDHFSIELRVSSGGVRNTVR